MQDKNFTIQTFLLDMWMLIHVYIQAISDVFSDLKLATNTHVTHMPTYVQVIPAIICDFYDLFCSLFFYPAITHPAMFLPINNTFYLNIARMFWTMNTLVMSKATNCGYVMTPGDCVVFSNCQYVGEFIF